MELQVFQIGDEHKAKLRSLNDAPVFVFGVIWQAEQTPKPASGGVSGLGVAKPGGDAFGKVNVAFGHFQLG